MDHISQDCILISAARPKWPVFDALMLVDFFYYYSRCAESLWSWFIYDDHVPIQQLDARPDNLQLAEENFENFYIVATRSTKIEILMTDLCFILPQTGFSISKACILSDTGKTPSALTRNRVRTCINSSKDLKTNTSIPSPTFAIKTTTQQPIQTLCTVAL